MSDHEPEMPKLSGDLRVTLSKVFALGFLDAMAGSEVIGDDLVVGIDAGAIEALALACIEKGEDMIAADYIENPQMVHDETYAAGRWAYAEAERQAIQRN